MRGVESCESLLAALSKLSALTRNSVAFEVPLLGWFLRGKRVKSSWGSGGRCKPPSMVWGSAPEAFENYAYNEAIFAHFDDNCLGKVLTSNL